MLAQRLVVEIHHRHRAMIAGVKTRVHRAEAERTLRDRNISAADIPRDERLAITAINPRAGIRKVIRQRVFFSAFLAHDNAARARHREIGAMFEAMNFDYVCKHWGDGEWGMGSGE